MLSWDQDRDLGLQVSRPRPGQNELECTRVSRSWSPDRNTVFSSGFRASKMGFETEKPAVQDVVQNELNSKKKITVKIHNLPTTDFIYLTSPIFTQKQHRYQSNAKRVFVQYQNTTYLPYRIGPCIRRNPVTSLRFQHMALAAWRFPITTESISPFSSPTAEINGLGFHRHDAAGSRQAGKCTSNVQ